MIVGEVNVSNAKFHQVFEKDLSVALEATLNADSAQELEIDRDLYRGNENLIFRCHGCWRIYYPAIVSGNVTSDTEATISFLPWFSGPEVLYHRLVLRAKPIAGKVFRWLMLARTGEEKPFTFSPDKAYINLDFFSKRNDIFLPLFVKAKADSGELIYFVLEGQWSEEGVILKIRRITESEAPPYLVAAKP